jgi:hypothetical protein
MITKEKIGKVQFYLGILIFVITIISSIFIVKNVYIGSLIMGVESTTTTWSEVSQEINVTQIGMQGHLVSNIMLQGQIIKTTMYLYGICALLLIVLSVILVLQGLANQSKK